MGSELATRNEFWEEASVDWKLAHSRPHRGVQQLIADLNRLHVKEAALHELEFEWTGFEWLEADDASSSAISFVRRGKNPDDAIIVVCNFTPIARASYRVAAPWPGYYREILNTDSSYYCGGDVGNGGGVHAESVPWKGKAQSIQLRLPPLAAIYLKPQRD
jgi:1,4-alpha-glucan branching enzyme